MGQNGGLISLPLLPGQRGGQGPELPLSLLSLALPCLEPEWPCLLAFCPWGQGNIPSCMFPTCAMHTAGKALLTAASLLVPDSPRRFISARSNGTPFWGIVGNEVL